MQLFVLKWVPLEAFEDGVWDVFVLDTGFLGADGLGLGLGVGAAVVRGCGGT